MKLKRRKKSSRNRGRRTCGYSAKLHKGKGSKGGKGMSGTGKRADQKKSLVIKLYGNKYFGKQGVTSKKTEKKKVKIINLSEIESRFSGKKEINLEDYKVLGEGEVKGKFIIKAKAASKSALTKIKKSGGDVILKNSFLEPSLKKKPREETEKTLEKEEAKKEENKEKRKEENKEKTEKIKEESK